MNTETFVETLKPGNVQINVTIVRIPADVSDLNTSARGFLTVGAEISSVERVTVTRESATYPGNPMITEGFQVTFRCGAVGWITPRREMDELDALVVGTTGYLHGLAVFRKHKHIVGSPTPWFRCQRSKRARMNPDSAPKCCAAELYARAAGKSWGV